MDKFRQIELRIVARFLSLCGGCKFRINDISEYNIKLEDEEHILDILKKHKERED
jgi:hypothetical protein